MFSILDSKTCFGPDLTSVTNSDTVAEFRPLLLAAAADRIPRFSHNNIAILKGYNQASRSLVATSFPFLLQVISAIPPMYAGETNADAIMAGTQTSGSFLTRIQTNRGKPLLGSILSLSCTAMAKIMGRQGFDWVMIDMEHAPFTMHEATELVHVIVASSQGKCLPVIRIPSDGSEWIKWALDSGATGIIIPMVHNAQQARAIVEKALYPPHGSRSFGPYSAPWGDAKDTGATFTSYYEKARREEIAILPIIESREGVHNADEIMKVRGITGVFIGPYDLRLSMGLPGGSSGDEPEFTSALDKICRIGRTLGKPVGSMSSGAALVQKRAAQGMQFLLCSFDRNAFIQGAQSDLRAAVQGIDDETKL